jgi:hypothetical protein
MDHDSDDTMSGDVSAGDVRTGPVRHDAALASIGASLRRAYAQSLAEPLPPTVEELLLKVIAARQ